VYNYSLDPCGPVYITVDDGGNIEGIDTDFADDPGKCPGPGDNQPEYGGVCHTNFTSGPAKGNFCWDEQPEWSAFRESSFGHGILEVAIPVVPTVRVIVTFTKFEELQPSEEFSTPPSSPGNFQDMKAKEYDAARQSSNSWFQWIKGPYSRGSAVPLSQETCLEEFQDPFVIPSDYTWTTMDAKKQRTKEKKVRTKRGKKPGGSSEGAESSCVERELF
jgi:hypothetical protein